MPLLLCVAWMLSSYASLLDYPTNFDATTYKNLTDTKAKILFFLHDTFATDSIEKTKVAVVRLKLAQVYEYERGEGEKKKDTFLLLPSS